MAEAKRPAQFRSLGFVRQLNLKTPFNGFVADLDSMRSIGDSFHGAVKGILIHVGF